MMRTTRSFEEAEPPGARSGQVDFLGFMGSSQVTSIDQLESLQRTNPDLVAEGYNYRSETSPVINMSRPPFDNVRSTHGEMKVAASRPMAVAGVASVP